MFVELIRLPIGSRAAAIQEISPKLSPTTHQEIHPSTSHRINLIQGLPLLIGDAQGLSRLDSPFHVAGPHLQRADALGLNEVGQGISILETGAGCIGEEEGRKREMKEDNGTHKNKLRSVKNGGMLMNIQEYRV